MALRFIIPLLTGLAAAFLVFLAGSVTTYYEVFPYSLLRNAYLAADAVLKKPDGESREELYLGSKPFAPEDAITPSVRWEQSGVDRYDPELAYDGYTVYTPVRSTFPLRLVDMQGETVWEWSIDWDRLSGERLDGLPIRLDNELARKRALGLGEPTVFPNGDLLIVVNTAWYTPWGLGLFKVDKFGEPLWSYTRQVHHEVSVAPDGRIFALTHETVKEPWPGLEFIPVPFLDDGIAVLSPDGEELQHISVLEAIQRSDYSSLLMYADPDDPKGDLLHTNSIFYLNERHAQALPNARAGDVLVSFRNPDVLAVVRVETGEVVWAARGPWRLQHDADVLDNGNILLFDNRGDLATGGGSRVLEVDPQSLAIRWEYPGTLEERLYTSVLGSQKRLPNGNTLICESNNGRILEVTRSGKVVWEYRIPEVVEKPDGRRLASVVFANRLAPEQLPFLDNP